MSAAYSTQEIEEKTKPLRESLNYSVGDDASAVEVRVTELCFLTALFSI